MGVTKTSKVLPRSCLRLAAIFIKLKQFMITNKPNLVRSHTLQHITYHTYAGSSRSKEETILIIENKTDGCLQTRNEKYRINLQVPPIPPTDDTTSNICKVRYFIRVSIGIKAQTTNYAWKMIFFPTNRRYMGRLHVVTAIQLLECQS